MKTPPFRYRTLFFIALEHALIVFLLSLAYFHRSFGVWAAVFVVISTRQHALWMLFHDAVHFHISRSHRLNDAIGGVLLGVPLGLLLHEFRAVHFAHHRYLGTDEDPERKILYPGQPWKYHPLPAPALAIQLLGDLLMINNLRSLWLSLREKRNPSSKLHQYWKSPAPEFYLTLGVFLGALGWIFVAWPELFRVILALWILPLLTLSHFLHKLRSFAEHSDDSADLTYSWNAGWLGRATIWPYNIQYHREHHRDAGVPWYELPAALGGAPQRAGIRFGRLLLRK